MRTSNRRHQVPVSAARRAVAGKVALLFDEHTSMVLGLCRLLLRDHHEAEDAAQQTFVSAYRSMLRGNEPRDPAPWLAAIARNECRARMRKRMRAPVALDSELENQLADPSDLTELADRRSELTEITHALADLPIRQREAVALRDFLGLSYEEVASTLSVSVPVVESLLFRARRRLRDTVRTVPRYAAGIVAVPIALRAALVREVPDLDSVGPAGVVGGAAAALGAGLAKLISLPFATKAVTTIAVVAAGTVVAPLLDHPTTTPSRPSAAGPAAVVMHGSPAVPSPSHPATEAAPDETAQALEPAQPAPSDPGEHPDSDASASSTTLEAAPGDSGPSAPGVEPDRLSAAASTESSDTAIPPPPPADTVETGPAPACTEPDEPAEGSSGEASACPATDDVKATTPSDAAEATTPSGAADGEPDAAGEPAEIGSPPVAEAPAGAVPEGA